MDANVIAELRAGIDAALAGVPLSLEKQRELAGVWDAALNRLQAKPVAIRCLSHVAQCERKRDTVTNLSAGCMFAQLVQ